MPYPDDDNLTKIETLRAWLGIPAAQTQADPHLQDLIVRVSNALVLHTGRDRCISGAVTEIRDGSGQSKIMVVNGPIASVSLVQVGSTVYASSNGTVTGYRVTSSSIVLVGATFDRGVSNVTLTYVGGWAASSKQQRMLEQACLDWCNILWKSRERAGLNLVMRGNDVMEKFEAEAIPASVERTVERLMNVIPRR